jgi:hypothetical protein
MDTLEAGPAVKVVVFGSADEGRTSVVAANAVRAVVSTSGISLSVLSIFTRSRACSAVDKHR